MAIPYTFTNGTVANADEVNSNFVLLQQRIINGSLANIGSVLCSSGTAYNNVGSIIIPANTFTNSLKIDGICSFVRGSNNAGSNTTIKVILSGTAGNITGTELTDNIDGGGMTRFDYNFKLQNGSIYHYGCSEIYTNPNATSTDNYKQSIFSLINTNPFVMLFQAKSNVVGTSGGIGYSNILITYD